MKGRRYECDHGLHLMRQVRDNGDGTLTALCLVCKLDVRTVMPSG